MLVGRQNLYACGVSYQNRSLIYNVDFDAPFFTAANRWPWIPLPQVWSRVAAYQWPGLSMRNLFRSLLRVGDSEHVVGAFTHIPGAFPLLRVSHSRSSQRCILGIHRCETDLGGRGHPGWLVIRSGAAGRGSNTVTASARDSRANSAELPERRSTSRTELRQHLPKPASGRYAAYAQLCTAHSSIAAGDHKCYLLLSSPQSGTYTDYRFK